MSTDETAESGLGKFWSDGDKIIPRDKNYNAKFTVTLSVVVAPLGEVHVSV